MSYNNLRKGRFSLRNHVYFVTTVTNQRTPYFLEKTISEIVIDEINKLHNEKNVSSLSWVLMPDHLHWIFELKEISLGNVMKYLKGRSSIKINNLLNNNGSIWQKSFYERSIRNDCELENTTHYIMENPIRAGIVQNIREYPYCWISNQIYSGFLSD